MNKLVIVREEGMPLAVTTLRGSSFKFHAVLSSDAEYYPFQDGYFMKFSQSIHKNSASFGGGLSSRGSIKTTNSTMNVSIQGDGISSWEEVASSSTNYSNGRMKTTVEFVGGSTVTLNDGSIIAVIPEGWELYILTPEQYESEDWSAGLQPSA